jgi:hypothetical protein
MSRVGELLQQVGRPVSFFPELARAVGGTGPGLFLCQLIYWDGKGKDPEGWIYGHGDRSSER